MFMARSAVRLLKEARARSGISQAELARRAGITRSVLNTYEHGKREPGGDTLISILAAAGFDIELRPLLDYEENARILHDVLALATRLPFEPKKRLAYPRFADRAG